jgi:hypothetical protein
MQRKKIFAKVDVTIKLLMMLHIKSGCTLLLTQTCVLGHMGILETKQWRAKTTLEDDLSSTENENEIRTEHVNGNDYPVTVSLWASFSTWFKNHDISWFTWFWIIIRGLKDSYARLKYLEATRYVSNRECTFLPGREFSVNHKVNKIVLMPSDAQNSAKTGYSIEHHRRQPYENEFVSRWCFIALFITKF